MLNKTTKLLMMLAVLVLTAGIIPPPPQRQRGLVEKAEGSRTGHKWIVCPRRLSNSDHRNRNR